jgi:hypothetical protein
MTQTKQATTETKPTTQKNLTPAQVFKRELGMYEKTLVKLLEGNGVSVDKFMMVVDNAVRKVPALLNVDRKTLFASVLTAAEMGLEPNTPMGLSYLIPFKNQCQFGNPTMPHLIPMVYWFSGLRVCKRFLTRSAPCSSSIGMSSAASRNLSRSVVSSVPPARFST